ncbi:MAG: autotransporter domain-containing protein [Thermoguttaceae bacterium]
MTLRNWIVRVGGGGNLGKITRLSLAALIAAALATPAFAQETWAVGTGTASVDVTDGSVTNLTSSGAGTDVVNNDNLAFADDDTLTISGDISTTVAPEVTTLGTVTTANDGDGTLVINLDDAADALTIGNIGSGTKALKAFSVTQGTITTGDIYAGALTVATDGTLKANDLSNTTTSTISGTHIITGNAELGTGYTLDAGTLLATANATVTGNIALDAGGGTLLAATGKTMTIEELITGTGDLTIGDTANKGTVALNGNVTLKGDTIVAFGTLDIIGDGGAGKGLIIDTGGSLAVHDGATLRTSMYEATPGTGDWTSNLAVTGTNALTLSDGSVWSITGAAGYTGGEIIGGYDLAGNGDADAALALGNSKNAFFNYSLLLDSGTTYNLNGVVKDDINVSNAAKNIAGLVNLGKFQSLTQSRANFFNSNFDNSYRGQCEDSCKKLGFSGQNAWVNYVGRYTELEATNTLQAGQKNKLSSNGVQLGMDLYRDRCNIFGVLFGYEALKSEIAQDRVKGNDYYFGFYGARMMSGGFDLRGSLGYGHQTYKMDRFENGTALPVEGMYRSSFSGNTFESSIDIGRRYYLNRCLSYRPMIGLDFYNNQVGSGTEDGGLIFSDASLTQTFLRVGSDAQWRGRCFDLNGGLYYAYQMAENGNVLRTGASNGTVGGFANGAKLGNSVLTFNAGTQYYLNASKSWSLFGNYYGDIFCDRDGTPLGHTVFAGMNYKF